MEDSVSLSGVEARLKEFKSLQDKSWKQVQNCLQSDSADTLRMKKLLGYHNKGSHQKKRALSNPEEVRSNLVTELNRLERQREKMENYLAKLENSVSHPSKQTGEEDESNEDSDERGWTSSDEELDTRNENTLPVNVKNLPSTDKDKVDQLMRRFTALQTAVRNAVEEENQLEAEKAKLTQELQGHIVRAAHIDQRMSSFTNQNGVSSNSKSSVDFDKMKEYFSKLVDEAKLIEEAQREARMQKTLSEKKLEEQMQAKLQIEERFGEKLKELQSCISTNDTEAEDLQLPSFDETASRPSTSRRVPRPSFDTFTDYIVRDRQLQSESLETSENINEQTKFARQVIALAQSIPSTQDRLAFIEQYISQNLQQSSDKDVDMMIWGKQLAQYVVQCVGENGLNESKDEYDNKEEQQKIEHDVLPPLPPSSTSSSFIAKKKDRDKNIAAKTSTSTLDDAHYLFQSVLGKSSRHAAILLDLCVYMQSLDSDDTLLDQLENWVSLYQQKMQQRNDEDSTGSANSDMDNTTGLSHSTMSTSRFVQNIASSPQLSPNSGTLQNHHQTKENTYYSTEIAPGVSWWPTNQMDLSSLPLMKTKHNNKDGNGEMLRFGVNFEIGGEDDFDEAERRRAARQERWMMQMEEDYDSDESDEESEWLPGDKVKVIGVGRDDEYG
eukprot:g1221.t1